MPINGKNHLKTSVEMKMTNIKNREPLISDESLLHLAYVES